MKRKIFVLALGFMSLVSVLSFTTNEQETTDRKFWGWSEWSCSGNEYMTCCTRVHYDFGWKMDMM